MTGGGSNDVERTGSRRSGPTRTTTHQVRTRVITGTGWQPDEEVRLLFQEDPAVHDDYVLTVTADGAGNIYRDQWAPRNMMRTCAFTSWRAVNGQGAALRSRSLTRSTSTICRSQPCPSGRAGRSATFVITVKFNVTQEPRLGVYVGNFTTTGLPLTSDRHFLVDLCD